LASKNETALVAIFTWTWSLAVERTASPFSFFNDQSVLTARFGSVITLCGRRTRGLRARDAHDIVAIDLHFQESVLEGTTMPSASFSGAAAGSTRRDFGAICLWFAQSSGHWPQPGRLKSSV